MSNLGRRPLWSAALGFVLTGGEVSTTTAQGNKNRRVLSMIEGISAVTLGTHEMPRAVRFYRAWDFEVLHGGEESSSPSFGGARPSLSFPPMLPSGARPGGS